MSSSLINGLLFWPLPLFLVLLLLLLFGPRFDAKFEFEVVAAAPRGDVAGAQTGAAVVLAFAFLPGEMALVPGDAAAFTAAAAIAPFVRQGGSDMVCFKVSPSLFSLFFVSPRPRRDACPVWGEMLAGCGFWCEFAARAGRGWFGGIVPCRRMSHTKGFSFFRFCFSNFSNFHLRFEK